MRRIFRFWGTVISHRARTIFPGTQRAGENVWVMVTPVVAESLDGRSVMVKVIGWVVSFLPSTT